MTDRCEYCGTGKPLSTRFRSRLICIDCFDVEVDRLLERVRAGDAED